jgi:hypothetical protein
MSYTISGPVTLGSTGAATAVSGTVSLPDVSTTQGDVFTLDASGNLVGVGVGTASQVLTSNGAGAVPTWQAAAAGVDESLSATKVAADTFTTTPTIVPNWTVAAADRYADVVTFDAATGIATITNAGKYSIKGMINYTNTGASANTGSRTLEIFDGTNPLQTVTIQPTGDTSIDQSLEIAADLQLAAAATISLRFYATAQGGTPTNTILATSSFSLHKFA